MAAADDWGSPMEIKAITPSRPDSYERVFRQTLLPRSITDLRGGKSNDVREALSLLEGDRLEPAAPFLAFRDVLDRDANAALAAMYKLPQPVDVETAAILQRLDESIETVDDPSGDVYRRLRTGVVAMLAAAGDEKSLAYLRKVWREDPERRQAVALGLSLHPDGENWDYLVRSLNILESAAAGDVMSQLATVRVATDDPEGWDFFQQTFEYADSDPDIKILNNLNNVGAIEVNAFQSQADVVLQKSIREGFGLTVAEALWKRKPVIGGDTGGIRLQVIDHHTGFLVSTPEGAALLPHRPRTSAGWRSATPPPASRGTRS